MCDLGEELRVDGESVVEWVAGAGGKAEGEFSLAGVKYINIIVYPGKSKNGRGEVIPGT